LFNIVKRLRARHSKLARVGIFLGAGGLFVGIAGAQTIADERRLLEAAKVQSVEAEARAARLAARAASAKNLADRAAADSAAVAARIQSAEADITAAEARIRLIESLRAEQRVRLAKQQEPAVRLIAALQMMARRPPALALVQPGTTTDLVHVRSVLASMMPVLRKRTQGLRAEIARGRQLRVDADRALVVLGVGQKRLEAERLTLVQLAAKRRQQSLNLSSSAMLEQDRAIALGEKARDIVDLIDQLGEASEVRNRLEDLPGPVLRPIRPGAPRAEPTEQIVSTGGLPAYRLPVTGRVVTGLGEVSDTGIRARGLTIQTRPQAQVVSPASGRIAFAGPYRGFGRIVIIDHGRSWTTLITNLGSLDVRVGDQMVQGSPIGKAASENPSITIELRKGVTPIDITPMVS
jgi:murein hydrolase activator